MKERIEMTWPWPTVKDHTTDIWHIFVKERPDGPFSEVGTWISHRLSWYHRTGTTQISKVSYPKEFTDDGT